MLLLFSSYFLVQDPSTFYRDLEQKDFVFLLRDAGGMIRGFSTLAVSPRNFAGRDLLLFFSGDTIIHRDYWGSMELPRTWIRTALAIAEQRNLESYWLLISGGYRTYRMLPLFCEEFYPSVQGGASPSLKGLMDSLATGMFGSCYDPVSGIIRFPVNATPLRPGIGEIHAGRRKNPHISFFETKNPGHAMGEELVCIAPLRRDNLTVAARRILSQVGTPGIPFEPDAPPIDPSSLA